MYAAGTNQGVDYIEAAGDAESVTSILTMSGGTLAVVSNSRSNGRGHDVRLELLGSDLEVGLVPGGDGNWDTAGQRDAWGVGHERRLVVDHLVTGVADGAQGRVDRLGRTDRDDQLSPGLITDPVARL